jgi:GcrA cell cycle regulator
MSYEWTAARIATLMALWNEGLSTSAIGGRLGITKNAVVGKVHRLGLPKRHAPARAKPPEKPRAPVVKLEDMKVGMCLWPEGDPGREGFGFCGEPAVPDKPYCAFHCERAYVKIVREPKKAAA